MARINQTLWDNAQRDADIILGVDKFGHGRGRSSARVAEQDPLAWWCLVELLVSYAEGRKS